MKNLSYSLRQIASWTSNKSEVLIPALQRGLVWKPRQVELLWDSILRGFPIGSFMLSDIVNNEGAGKYYLMDGQQRYNAISIGFNTVPNARAVLWIDLVPPSSKSSTRTFWVKATTTPHPWGFKNDDDANRLNTAEKRNALNEFNLKGNIYNDHFSLTETWPIEANLPIPLFCLLEAAEKSNDDKTFADEALAIFNATNFSFRKSFNEKFKQSDIALDYLRGTLFPAFKALKDYTITCNHLPKEVMETETTEDSAAQTTLEVLFTRLNTGGTAISRDDLNYSAIKAYWPSIKDVNDALAEKYMNPAKLVMLAFRLALTSDEDKNFKNEMTIKQIRSAAKKLEEKEKIEALYKDNQLEIILDKVDEWLGVKEETDLRTPSILRTIIARNSPDVYLLLMYLASKDAKSSINLTIQEIRALAFLLHWFGNDKKSCVQEMFYRFKKGINRHNILMGISRLMHDCQLLHVYTPTEVRKFFTIEESRNWRLWKSLSAPSRNFFDRTFWYGTAEAKQILLYAEREYINTHFRNYDPARQDMWAEENRPWDFDHIVPQDWITGKRNADYREYDKDWLWSIGNMAAISFEANRSKSNSSQYSEYHDNKESLHYLQDIESIKSDITYNQHQSVNFAKITFERYCMIYAAAYSVIKPLVEEVVLSDTLQKRKELILAITKELPEAKAHFAANDGNDHWIEREQDWAREWIGIGIVIGDFMACYEWHGVIDNGFVKNAEVGIRKAPGTQVTRENQRLFNGDDADSMELNDWWYDCKFDFQSLDANVIVEEMKSYMNKIRQVAKL